MTNEETIKAYLKGNKESGINSNKTIFFSYEHIFSYGAHYLLGLKYGNGILLVNNYRYSATTGKHISMLERHAFGMGYKVFEVPNLNIVPLELKDTRDEYQIQTDLNDHKANIAYYENMISEAETKLKRARKDNMKSFYQSHINHIKDTLNDYKECFNL